MRNKMMDNMGHKFLKNIEITVKNIRIRHTTPRIFAMRNIVAFWLCFWGIVIDGILLGGMPLTGNCQAFEALIKMGPPCDAASLPGLLISNIYLLCGVLRLAAGMCPHSAGCWNAGMASMVLEFVMVYQVWSLPSSPSKGAVDFKDGAFVMCATTLAVMMRCRPRPGSL